MVICPQCGAELDFEEDELDEGDEFTCEECGANLRVVSVDPIEIESVDEDDDDAGDEDDYDEDENDVDDDEDDFDDEDEEERHEDWR